MKEIGKQALRLLALCAVPVPVAAAAGYCAVFGAASRTLLAPALIAGEVFGWEFLPFGLLCCAAARVCSGGATIYPAQRTE